MYRKEFHARVNTDNLTESFNNVLKNHYLTLRHDKSVYSLTKILLHCVFPDQEREYIILTARQSSAHRKSRSTLPHFLLNRPAHVQNACISNIEKGKRISPVSISEVSSKDGIFKVKSSKGDYEVSIIGGSCSCPYFSQERIPCKHMFSIFENYSWSWKDLPSSLTESPYMTLETDLLQRDGSLDQQQQLELEIHGSDQTSADEIPHYQSQGAKLLSLQKQTRDAFAKCSTAVFMLDDVDVLEKVNLKVNEIYSDLMQTLSHGKSLVIYRSLKG